MCSSELALYNLFLILDRTPYLLQLGQQVFSHGTHDLLHAVPNLVKNAFLLCFQFLGISLGFSYVVRRSVGQELIGSRLE